MGSLDQAKRAKTPGRRIGTPVARTEGREPRPVATVGIWRPLRRTGRAARRLQQRGATPHHANPAESQQIKAKLDSDLEARRREPAPRRTALVQDQGSRRRGWTAVVAWIGHRRFAGQTGSRHGIVSDKQLGEDEDEEGRAYAFFYLVVDL
jgi:hypothetical protein